MSGRALAEWYARHGRHDLPWRATRERWAVLVSEVMLQQTQVARVLAAYGPFLERFPTPEAMAAAAPGDVIEAWGRLGYPRRARRLWEAAQLIAAHGWPRDLTELPGVGRYTAAAVRALADEQSDAVAVETNVRRVAERVRGTRLTPGDAERAEVEIAEPLVGRDRLLALMDLGATRCTPRDPACDECPLGTECSTHGVLEGESRSRQPPFAGSFRERRGRVMARLRAGPAASDELDQPALDSLVRDGLAEIEADEARLPAS